MAEWAAAKYTAAATATRAHKRSVLRLPHGCNLAPLAVRECHALIPRSPAIGVRLRVRLFGALGRVRDTSGFPSVPFPRTQIRLRQSSCQLVLALQRLQVRFRFKPKP